MNTNINNPTTKSLAKPKGIEKTLESDDNFKSSTESFNGLTLEEQLSTGINLIQTAFSTKTTLLMDEIANWKQLSNSQKQQIASLESTVATLNGKTQELTIRIEKSVLENESLISSKHELAEKYTDLRKNALQLESFRKSIVSMVSLNPVHGIASEQLPIDDDHPPQPKQSVPVPFEQVLVPQSKAPKLSAEPKNNNLNSKSLDLPPKPPKTPVLLVPGHPPSPKNTSKRVQSLMMDAPTVYRQIRDIVSPESYKLFSNVVNAFNQGQLKAHDAIEQINEIVPDDALCIQMEILIKQVINS